MGAGHPSQRWVPRFPSSLPEFLWDAYLGTVWPLGYPSPFQPKFPSAETCLVFWGCKGEVFLEVGYWLLARIELVIVRSQPCGYASLDTARISCPLLPAPSQTKPHTKHWNFLLTLPTEFKLQVIREGFCFFLIFWPDHTACGILVP